MSGLKLVIGTRNASSWSLRAWLLLKQLDLTFEEVVVPLQQPDTALHIRRYSPSGKVPVLFADGLCIWDTLAIAEFMAERYPSLWPDDAATRSLARSVVCELHSGFAALRSFLPMDFTARFGPPGRLLAAVEGDVDRIEAIWADCQQASSEPGPYLFGSFTIADAMFAPVCSRFTTHAVPLEFCVPCLCRAHDGPAGDAGLGPCRRGRSRAHGEGAVDRRSRDRAGHAAAAGGAPSTFVRHPATGHRARRGAAAGAACRRGA